MCLSSPGNKKIKIQSLSFRVHSPLVFQLQFDFQPATASLPTEVISSSSSLWRREQRQYPSVAFAWRLSMFPSERSLTILVAAKLGWKTNRNLTDSCAWCCSYNMNKCSEDSGYTNHHVVSKRRETEPMRLWTSPQRSICPEHSMASLILKERKIKHLCILRGLSILSLGHLWKYCINPEGHNNIFGLRTILIIGKMIVHSK